MAAQLAAVLEGIGLRLLGFVLDRLADRTNARMRVDAHSAFLMASAGSMLSHHEARLFVYNAGRRRFTVNKAGWRAKDGARLVAHPESPQTVEPGAAEIEYTKGADNIVEFHHQHGGISGTYVHLAGDKKPKDRRVRSDWIAEVEAMARKPAVTRY